MVFIKLKTGVKLSGKVRPLTYTYRHFISCICIILIIFFLYILLNTQEQLTASNKSFEKKNTTIQFVVPRAYYKDEPKWLSITDCVLFI